MDNFDKTNKESKKDSQETDPRGNIHIVLTKSALLYALLIRQLANEHSLDMPFLSNFASYIEFWYL